MQNDDWIKGDKSRGVCHGGTNGAWFYRNGKPVYFAPSIELRAILEAIEAREAEDARAVAAWKEARA